MNNCTLLLVVIVGGCLLFKLWASRSGWTGLIGADQFLATYALYRQAWFRGRPGSGKTLLSVAMGYELTRRGVVDGCICNIPTSLPLPKNWRETILQNAYILFDEAGQELDNRRSMSNPTMYGRYTRKLNTYWGYPSATAIDKRVSPVIVERVMRISIPILPLVWVYRYSVELGYAQEHGYFGLTGISKYFKMFDSTYIPIGDGDIADAWARTVYEMTKDNYGKGAWYKLVERELANNDGPTIALTSNHTTEAGQTAQEPVTDGTRRNGNSPAGYGTSANANDGSLSYILETTRGLSSGEVQQSTEWEGYDS